MAPTWSCGCAPAALVLLWTANPGPAAEPGDVLAGLRAGHPRLVCTPEDVDRVKGLVKEQELARSYLDSLREQAEGLLDDAPVEHKLVGPRLLSQSRRCLDRVYTLALMYRLEGDQRFAERARTELLAAAGFPDWNPSHFLDTAEMSHALAIGYDWLYDFLGEEDRGAVRQALVEKGLRPGEKCYRGEEGYGWWVRCNHNWNQVCNGGLMIAALAVADEEPELARFIVSEGLKSLPRAVGQYAPDGGWAEGPGYWHYATRYTVYLLAALQSALGTDFGLSDTEGFSQAGRFRLYFVGPTGLTFNYADAGAGSGRAEEMFWLARAFGEPTYAWDAQQAGGRPSAFDLVWFQPQAKSPGEAGLPRDGLFRGVQVAFLRSAWDDPQAVWVGFKGGDNRANHSHLDLGSFVLDALGQRWALDLGADGYNLPGYFGRERFTYYRLRTEGHNTLVINGDNQVTSAKAPIISFLSQPDRAHAVADLTAAYAPQASRVWRGVALLDRRTVVVQDEIEAPEPVEIAWGLHTKAEVQVDGATARLELGGQALAASIVEPAGAAFQILEANPPAPQAQQPDVRKLSVKLPAKTRHARIVVAWTPLAAGLPEQLDLTVAPLDEWVKFGER